LNAHNLHSITPFDYVSEEKSGLIYASRNTKTYACRNCLNATQFVVSGKHTDVPLKQVTAISAGKDHKSKKDAQTSCGSVDESWFEIDEHDFSADLHYIIGSINIKSKQKKLPMLLDCGAQVNLIDKIAFEGLPFEVVRVKVSLESVTGQELRCYGLCKIPVQLGKLTVTVPFLIVSELPYPALVSSHFLQRAGVRLDYARQVLDFFKNGQYSGPVKMILDVKGQDKLSNYRVKRESLRELGVHAALFVGKRESENESERDDRYDSGIVDVRIGEEMCEENPICLGVLAITLTHSNTRVKAYSAKSISIPGNGQVLLEVPVTFDNDNLVQRFYHSL
jgi:hypothetical protein